MSQKQKENKHVADQSVPFEQLPAKAQEHLLCLRVRHKDCWRPELNSPYPRCVVESVSTSDEAMLCLRLMTLDHDRYVAFIVWYLSKMSEFRRTVVVSITCPHCASDDSGMRVHVPLEESKSDEPAEPMD